MSDDLIVVAGTVRPFLLVLLGEVEGARMDSWLADLLAEARNGSGAGPEIGDRIAAALAADPTVHALAAAILAEPDRRPPRVREVRPAGDGEIVDVERFVCGAGDYVWYRLYVGEPVPQCPTHGPLTPVGQQPR